MRRNPETWNPGIPYVYTRALRLGTAEKPLMEIGSPVDLPDLIRRVGARRVRAFFMQGAISPAPAPQAPQSRFAAASAVDTTQADEE